MQTYLCLQIDGREKMSNKLLTNNEIATKRYANAVLKYRCNMMIITNNSQPTLPLKGNIWYDSNSSQMLIYDGTTWIPIATIEDEFQSIIEFIGEFKATAILTEEIVEEQLRKNDTELMALWKEYKTLAKLKTDYNKDLDNLLKTK